MIDVEKQKKVTDYKLWAKLTTYSKIEDVMWSYNFCVWVTLTIAVELIPGLSNTHRSHDQADVVTYLHLSSSIPGASLTLFYVWILIFGGVESCAKG